LMKSQTVLQIRQVRIQTKATLPRDSDTGRRQRVARECDHASSYIADGGHDPLS
jgi:hypothetical protein